MKLAIIALDEGSMTAGTVANIIEVTADTAMGITLPFGQLSWDCSNTSVSIGDRWEDGVFSRPNRTLDEAQSEKISQLSAVCNALIVAGADIRLADGSTQHFDYSTEDQLNISDMFSAVVLGASCYPYQPANGSCAVYQAADIVTIYTTLAGQKTAQLTYYHQLKDYVQTLETAAAADAVVYGQPLTGAWLEHYNATIQTAQQQMQAVLARLAGGSNAS
ncbi:hypothetical protein CE91St46_29610 [Eubacteriales bacterium]|nr:hypothetical protein CE91St46_29610 [Eubacteriales bacterium]GKH64569.1 hypothetical protein CE91St47_30380 [Eubacteriales bacterium]